MLIQSGISREVFDFLSVGVAYRFSYKDDAWLQYILKHRINGELKLKFPVGSYFDISGRVRYQRDYQVNVDKKEDKLPEDNMRFKIGADYDWPSSPYNPYTSLEFFVPMENTQAIGVEKHRFQVGVDYKLRKGKSLSVGFLYQKDHYPTTTYYYGLTFGYSFSL